MQANNFFSERVLHDLAQLSYLDVPTHLLHGGVATVGEIADYYAANKIGELYLKARFCSIAEEYAHWQEFLTSGIEAYRQFKIVNIVSDNAAKSTGFYGCTFDTGAEGLVVAFRGSEMLGDTAYKNDYKTDFALSYSLKTPQQKMVEEYFNRFPQILAAPFWVTGHSLGGNLAAYAAVGTPKPVRAAMQGAYAFNAPGFNNDFIHANTQAIGEAKLFLYQNRYDPVSSLLQAIAEPIITESAVNPHAGEELTVSELFYPHSNFAFAWEGDTLIRMQDPQKSAFCREVQAFSVAFLRLPYPLREGICGLLLEALYLPVSPKKELGYLLEKAGKYLSNNAWPNEAEASTEFASALYGAHLLTQKEETPRQLSQKLAAAEKMVSMSDVARLMLEGLRLTCDKTARPEQEA